MTNALIITLYGKLIKTTLELDIEIKKLQDKRGFLPDSLIAELADEHARRYACFIAQTATGVYKFYTSAEVSTATLHKTAVMQWSRTIGKLHNVVKSNRGGAHKTEAKPEWQKLGDAVLKLNKSEIDRLMKYIGRA
jgi:hypothetical protein